MDPPISFSLYLIVFSTRLVNFSNAVLNTQKTDTPGSQSSEDTLMAAMESQTQETVSASNNWSRIVRRPRKRTGHVIVDVCTAAG